MRTEVIVDINAAPERVWEIMGDVERWPEWTASVRKVDKLTDGPLAVGSKARLFQPKVPPVVWRVTELQPGRFFRWEATSPAMTSVGNHRVEPHGAGSRVTLSVEQTGLFAVLIGWWLRGMTRRYVEIEAAGLKSRAEALTA